MISPSSFHNDAWGFHTIELFQEVVEDLNARRKFFSSQGEILMQGVRETRSILLVCSFTMLGK